MDSTLERDDNGLRLPRVLVFLRHYLPASRFGGPIRSVENIGAFLGQRLALRLVCLNAEFGVAGRLVESHSEEWVSIGPVCVRYVQPEWFGPVIGVVRTLRDNSFDVLYLNSFFDPIFSILPQVIAKRRGLAGIRVVLAPRGEFAESALRSKALKKRIFIRCHRLLGLHRHTIFQASNEAEAGDIKRALGSDVAVRVVPNVAAPVMRSLSKRRQKVAGSLRLVFLSRISPMKNLRWLADVLRAVQGEILFDIWGPVGDSGYWKECRRALAALPTNVTVAYRGVASREQVSEILVGYDLFVLPTLGENFGHAVHDALSAGCPVLISNRTPWKDLEVHGVGADVSIDRPDGFTSQIQRFVDMSDGEYGLFFSRCVEFARQRASAKGPIDAHYSLLCGL